MDLMQAQFEMALGEFEQASAEYANAMEQELFLADIRPLVKQRAMLRILQTMNELTKKIHSASSAEEYVEHDAEYADHQKRIRESVRLRIAASARRDAARYKLAMLTQAA